MYQVAILEFLNMGGGEIALIMVAILLLFGGKKLPELARGLGKGIREFKDASEGVKREIHRNINAVDLDNEQDANLQERDKNQHPVVDATVQASEHELKEPYQNDDALTQEEKVEQKANETHS